MWLALKQRMRILKRSLKLSSDQSKIIRNAKILENGSRSLEVET